MLVLLEPVNACLNRNFTRTILGEAERASRDAGKRNGCEFEMICDFQSRTIGIRQRFGFAACTVFKDGADSMYDKLRLKVKSGRKPSVASGTWSKLSRSIHQFGPSRSMNSAINTTATNQLLICGINDCINEKLSNVTGIKFNASHQNFQAR